MATPKKSNEQASKIRNKAIETASDALEGTKKVDARAPADTQEVMGQLIDVLKTKAQMKSLKVMEKTLDEELKEEPEPTQAEVAASRMMTKPGQQPQQASPLAQILPFLPEDKRVEFMQELMAADKDTIYELLAGGTPAAKKLLPALKSNEPEKKQSTPTNDFMAMSEAMMNMAKMMGIANLSESAKEGNSMQNMLTMFTFFKDMMGGRQSGVDEGMKDLIRSLNDTNKDMMRAIADGNNNTMQAIKMLAEASKTNTPGPEQTLLQTLITQNMTQQAEVLKEQIASSNKAIEQEKEFWKNQLASQNQQLEQLRAIITTRPPPVDVSNQIRPIMDQINELKSAGLIRAEEDKDIQLKRMEIDAEKHKLDKTLQLQTDKAKVSSQNLASAVSLVSSILDRSRAPASTEPKTNPANPSPQVSKVVSMPLPPNAVARTGGAI